MTTTYYTATSLDGFIADTLPDGSDSLDWLFAQQHQEPSASSLRYDTLLSRIGAVMMGATTYLWVRERVVAAGEGWPYAMPTWVLTHRELPGVDGADVRFVAGEVRELHPRIVASAGERDVWHVGGGDLAGQLAEAGLLDEVVVGVAPVVLGSGRPLLPRRLQLRLTDLERAGGFACARYVVDGPRTGADWSA